MKLLPGQTRPLAFCMIFTGSKLSQFTLHIRYSLHGPGGSQQRLSLHIRFKDKEVHDPHRITYLHPSGIISYAILRPPSTDACKLGAGSMPIALVLHGAGLDVNSPTARGMLDEIPDLAAWVLVPSGVTTWCGDDWRGF